MVQRCCFCLNLRTGTILLALLTAVTSTAGAYVYWTWRKDIPYSHVAVRVVLAIAWTYRALVGFFALTAAVSRKHKFVRVVAVFVSLATLVATASAAFNVTVMWRTQHKFRVECSDQIQLHSNDGEEWDPMSHWLSGPFRKRQLKERPKDDSERVAAICSKAVTGFLVLVTVVEIVLVLFLFYFSVVISRYRNELKSKKFVRHIKNKLADNTRAIPSKEAKLSSTLSVSSEESIDLDDDRKLRRVISSEV